MTMLQAIKWRRDINKLSKDIEEHLLIKINNDAANASKATGRAIKGLNSNSKRSVGVIYKAVVRISSGSSSDSEDSDDE